MKHSSFFILLHLPLTCALFWQLPSAAFAENAAAHSKFAGVYVSQKASPSINLSLGADGSATITEDPGNGAITLFGHWVDSGGQVAVTFDAEEGKPAEPPMAFQPGHDGLQAVTWNHATWGKENPPPMKKGGGKVKEHYWLSENP